MVIWLGAATSKLNRHFPFVISTMLANNPFIPSGPLKRSMFKRYPDDLRPSGLAGFIAHFSTAVEGSGAAGAVLLPRWLADGHRRVRDDRVPPEHPAGLPDGCAAGVERVHDLRGALAVRRARAVGAVGRHQPVAVAVLFVVVAGTVVIGNLYPRKVSFLPGMRYYAGNWDTTLWCVKPSADEKIRVGSRALGPMYHLQLERLYKNKEESRSRSTSPSRSAG